MKTQFRKIISLLCIMAMLFSFAVPVMAANNSLAFDMEALGITAGMNASQREGEYVRRDEFAQMVVNMMLQQDVAKSLENEAYFNDIADSKYKGAVNLLVKKGYISGTSGGTFNPSDYITYGAACKILVHALGYNVIVENSSLDAYQYVAGNIKLTKDIDSSKQYLTFAQTMVMINNALDIGLMIPTYYNDDIAPSYEIDHGRTYRSYLNGRTGTGIVKMKGIVTADSTTFLYSPVNNLKENQLQIGGEVFTVNVNDIKGYVGQEVEFYVAYKDYDEECVTAFVPTNKNIIYDFSGNQIDKISSGSIEFYTGDVKNKVKIDASTRYIVNNRLVSGYKISELVADESVVIRTIDNNDDEIADVVFIYDYTDCIVEAVSVETNMISFESGFMYGKTKNLKLDEDEIRFEILDSKGNDITVEDIQAGDVVSIAMSKDEKFVRVVKGTNPVEGVVVSRDGDYIIIDDTEYVMGDTIVNANVKLGVKVVAYLNFLGTLVDYEEEKLEHNYGYVYSYSKTTGIGGGCKVKMLLPEYVSVRVMEGAVDELTGEAATSKSLFVRNKSVVIYPTEAKIVFDGSKVNAETALSKIVDKPVSFKFNENGNIYKIDTLDAVDDIEIKSSEIKSECVELSKKTYNATEQIFAKGRGNPFAIQEGYTLAFSVPLYSEQAKSTVSDEDLTVFVELASGLEYESNGYEMDETNEVVDVLVIQRVMNSNAAIAVVDTSDVGVVVAVSDVLLEDGVSEHKAITMLTDGKKQKFIISSARVDQKVFKTIAKNDLIQYTVDSFGYINTVKVLQKNNSYYESSTDDYMYGEVKDVQHNKVSNNKARRVNKVAVGYTGSSAVVSNLELLVRNPAPVFIIQGNEARIGSLNDINIGDMAYFSIYNIDSIRAVVIKR